MDELTVDLNRESPYAIDVEPPAFEAHESFDIVLTNHGSSTHTHLQLDEDLDRTADLDVANYFIKEDQVRNVRVAVREGNRPIRGRLKISTGYGSNTEYVPITIVDKTETESRVIVDEQLAKPQQQADSPLIRTDQLPVIALGLIALFVAVVSALIVGGWAAIVGVLIVLIGIGIAGLLLLQ